MLEPIYRLDATIELGHQLVIVKVFKIDELCQVAGDPVILCAKVGDVVLEIDLLVLVEKRQVLEILVKDHLIVQDNLFFIRESLGYILNVRRILDH